MKRHHVSLAIVVCLTVLSARPHIGAPAAPGAANKQADSPVMKPDATASPNSTELRSSSFRQIQLKKAGPIVVDGLKSEGEWDVASRVAIEVEPGQQATVLAMHDGLNLFVAFSGFVQSCHWYPEILISTQNDKALVWNDGHWWFHVSYRDCWSRGRYNDYSTCVPEALSWEANNYHSPQQPPEFIEVKIPFSTVGLRSNERATIGLSFVLTDTRTTWHPWPASADIGIPASWGERGNDRILICLHNVISPLLCSSTLSSEAIFWGLRGTFQLAIFV